MYLDHVYVLIFLFFYLAIPCFRIILIFVQILFSISNFLKQKKTNNNNNKVYSILTWCSHYSFTKAHGLLYCSCVPISGHMSILRPKKKVSVKRECVVCCVYTIFCCVTDVEMKIGYVLNTLHSKFIYPIKSYENVQKGSMMIM